MQYSTCATFELRDLLRSGATSHLTGTTQLTEGPRSQQVPDLKSRGGYPYNNLVFGEIRDHGEVQGSLNFKTPYSVPVCKYVYGTMAWASPIMPALLFGIIALFEHNA